MGLADKKKGGGEEKKMQGAIKNGGIATKMSAVWGHFHDLQKPSSDYVKKKWSKNMTKNMMLINVLEFFLKSRLVSIA